MREWVQRPRSQSMRQPAGRRLPERLSERMEAATGHDFSNIRVHLDAALPAPGMRAFTFGEDVHFAPGQYTPHTTAGQELIAHELVHVAQQRSGRAGAAAHPGPSIQLDPGLEGEADRVGRQMAGGMPTRVAQPLLPLEAASRVSNPVIQGYWVKKPDQGWIETDFDTQGDLQEKFNDSQREAREAELARIRGPLHGRGPRPSTIRNDPNNTRAAAGDLSKHLIRTGRASQPGTQADFATRAQVAAAQQAEANKTFYFAGLRGKTGKDLTPEQRQKVHPLAQRRGGGPDEVTKNAKLGEILRGMERATNQSYVANALYEKNKKTQPDLSLNQSLNETHDRLRDRAVRGDAAALAAANKVKVKSSHFYGRHGAQISKADQLARVAANVAPDKKPAVMPATTVDVADPTSPGATVAIPEYQTTGEDDALGVASGGFASHAANMYAIEEALAQAWHRPSPATQTARHTYEVTDETGGGPPNVTSVNVDKELRPQKQLDVDVNLPVPGGTARAPLYQGGFGTSYMQKSALAKNAPINAGQMQARLGGADFTVQSNQQSAHVILQQDAERGGFAVHTAYPQRLPRGVKAGDPTTVERGYVAADQVPRSHKVGNKASGAVAYVPKDKQGNFADIEQFGTAHPPEQQFARTFQLQPPVPSDTASETNLQERLQRIHDTGLTHQGNVNDPNKPSVISEPIRESDAIKNTERSLRRKKRKVLTKQGLKA